MDTLFFREGKTRGPPGGWKRREKLANEKEIKVLDQCCQVRKGRFINSNN